MHMLKHPNPDELVVTVLGGASQGESVVVHIGDGRWVVIDSYTSHNKSLPFLYLSSINAPLDKVELVICSHWHSDHVKGLYQILSQCPKARFYVPSVSKSEHYPEYFAGNYMDLEFSEEGVNTVLKEFNQCMNYAINNEILDYLERDKVLFKETICGQCIEISAISPSKEMRTRFNKMFASKENERYKEFGIVPNMCCSAIIISINNDLHLLLGADLESNRGVDDKDYENCPSQCEKRSLNGWCNSFIESQNHRYVGRYSYVKVAHHSSQTGYCPRLWIEKVTDDVIGTSTVFHANLLPQPDMMGLYSKKCKEYYITSAPPVPISDTDHPELELLKSEGIVKTITVPAGEMGTISSRFSIITKQYLGTDLDGSAFLFK